MATLTRTIQKATKLSGTAPRYDGIFYFCDYKGYFVSFARNGREDEATCFYTANEGRSENDHQSDYWPGIFHDNLTQAFRFIDQMVKR